MAYNYSNMLNWKKPRIKVTPNSWTPHREKPPADIERIYELLVGGRVRRTGRALLVICPFHDERRASCALYPDTQSYHCFSCGANGSAYDMVMKLKSCTFKEALLFIQTL